LPDINHFSFSIIGFCVRLSLTIQRQLISFETINTIIEHKVESKCVNTNLEMWQAFLQAA
jgi:hypothetical protein